MYTQFEIQFVKMQVRAAMWCIWTKLLFGCILRSSTDECFQWTISVSITRVEREWRCTHTAAAGSLGSCHRSRLLRRHRSGWRSWASLENREVVGDFHPIGRSNSMSWENTWSNDVFSVYNQRQRLAGMLRIPGMGSSLTFLIHMLHLNCV